MTRLLPLPDFFAALALLVVTSSCSSSNGQNSRANNDAAAPVQLEVFSWWVEPGEAEALASLIEQHQSMFPLETVYNAATDPLVTSGGVEAKEVLLTRLAQGDPPDTFQTDAGELPTFAAGILEPLDSFYAEQGLSNALVPEAISDVTVAGHLLGVPVDIHRSNGLFYNKQVFAQNNLQPPTTIDEFLTVCAALKQAGITPLALSSEPWIMDMVFTSFALATLGPDDYVTYIINQTPVDPARFAALADLLDVVMTNYVDAQAMADPQFGWTQAADAVYAGTAGMYLHGDWAKGYWTQLGWTPNVDFGVVASPGSDGVFMYNTDSFSVPAQAKHLSAGNDWLKTIASAEGQVKFNELKGSSPVRLDIPIARLDPMAQEIYADLKQATLRVPSVGMLEIWETAVVQLAKDHDKTAFVKVLIDNPLHP